MKTIYIADYSLKQLKKDRTVPLLFREKTALAEGLSAFGADAVELPAAEKPREDAIIYRTIAGALKNCALCLELGLEDESAELAWECIRNAEQPRLMLALPLSAAGMEYSLGLKENAVLEKLSRMLKAASAKCPAEFTVLDAGRTEDGLLLRALEEAATAGASAITLSDEAGVLLPEDWARLVKVAKGVTELPLYVQCSDALSLGAASALAALAAGADGVKCSVYGNDTLHTDVMAAILAAKGEELGLRTGLKTTEIHSHLELLTKKLGHHDFLSSGRGEEARSVGDVFLDSASTPAETASAVRSLGYDLSEEDQGRVFEALMKICAKKSSVGRRELEAIVSSAAMQVPSSYHLESYSIHSTNLTLSMAQLRLIKDGETLLGIATGDGPIDAAFRALEQCVGTHYELDDFQIQAVTEGKESLGSTLVKLRSGGKLYGGNGLSTDIVGASIRAYLNALNKIVYEEQS